MTRLSLSLAVVAAFILGATPVASAQAEQIVLDQWYGQYVANIKLAYGHMQITKRPGGFVLTRTEWMPYEGGTTVTKSRTETDAHGRLLRYENTETTHLGVKKKTAVKDDAGLKWTMRVRKQPEKKGTIQEVVHEEDIVAFLMARKERKAGKVVLHTLDFPNGAEEETFTGTWEGDTLQFADDESIAVLDDRGQILQVIRTDALGAEIQPASEAEARDMSRKLSQPASHPSLETNQVTENGITLRRPARGWALVLIPGQGQEQGRFMLFHPLEVFMIAQPISVSVPADEAGRERFSQEMADRLNSGGGDMRYSSPQTVQAWGLPAIRLQVVGEFVGHAVKGHSFFVRQSADRALMVMLLAPEDGVSQTASLVEAARNALSIKPQETKARPTSLQSADFPCGVTFKVPSDWTKGQRRGRTNWKSPGGSQMAVWLQPSPLDPRAGLERWSKELGRRFGSTPSPVAASSLGSRSAWKSMISVTRSGIAMNVLLMTADGGNDQLVMLMLVGGPDMKEADITRIISSASWSR